MLMSVRSAHSMTAGGGRWVSWRGWLEHPIPMAMLPTFCDMSHSNDKLIDTNETNQTMPHTNPDQEVEQRMRQLAGMNVDAGVRMSVGVGVGLSILCSVVVRVGGVAVAVVVVVVVVVSQRMFPCG